jgi:predicted ABC-class ATPase
MKKSFDDSGTAPLASRELSMKIKRLHGRPYGTYKSLRGRWRGGDVEYDLYHVQGDPFAPPSRLRAMLPLAAAGIPATWGEDPQKAIALCDFLHRSLIPQVAEQSRPSGTGRSGQILIAPLGPQILERSAVSLRDGVLEVRLSLGLPADQRQIDAEPCAEMLLQRIPEILLAGLWWRNLDRDALDAHVQCHLRQQQLRAQLRERGLVAFVPNGAVLPRAGSGSNAPLEGAVSFVSPPELLVRLQTEDMEFAGMGIPEGVTVIVGGGYHGKSTLLHALEQGIYNHIPDDGREYVVTREDALRCRTEEGRYVGGADLRWFVHDLPGKADPADFRTTAASGSTSQAASLVEGLEAGSRLFLIDEDASAVNFLVRDERMQRLLPDRREPLVPLVDRLPQLRAAGVSALLVIGASGEFLDHADNVISLEDYRPHLRTAEAKAICLELPSRRLDSAVPPAPPLRARQPAWEDLRHRAGKEIMGNAKVRMRDGRRLALDELAFDLSALDQLVSTGQGQAVGLALQAMFRQYDKTPATVGQMLDWIEGEMDRRGLDAVAHHREVELERPRRLEIACALFRVPHLVFEAV